MPIDYRRCSNHKKVKAYPVCPKCHAKFSDENSLSDHRHFCKEPSPRTFVKELKSHNSELNEVPA